MEDRNMKIDEFINKSISFEYTNEMDFEDSMFNINIIDQIYSGEHHCKIELNNLQNNEKTYPLDYSKFHEYFEKILSINFNELLIKSKMQGLDGSTLKINIGYGGSSIKFSIWCYDLDYKNRGLEEIYNIFSELLNICEIKLK